MTKITQGKTYLIEKSASQKVRTAKILTANDMMAIISAVKNSTTKLPRIACDISN